MRKQIHAGISKKMSLFIFMFLNFFPLLFFFFFVCFAYRNSNRSASSIVNVSHTFGAQIVETLMMLAKREKKNGGEKISQSYFFFHTDLKIIYSLSDGTVFVAPPCMDFHFPFFFASSPLSMCTIRNPIQPNSFLIYFLLSELQSRSLHSFSYAEKNYFH